MSVEHKAPNAEEETEEEEEQEREEEERRRKKRRRGGGGGGENPSFVIHSCVNASSGNPQFYFP